MKIPNLGDKTQRTPSALLLQRPFKINTRCCLTRLMIQPPSSSYFYSSAFGSCFSCQILKGFFAKTPESSRAEASSHLSGWAVNHNGETIVPAKQATQQSFLTQHFEEMFFRSTWKWTQKCFKHWGNHQLPSLQLICSNFFCGTEKLHWSQLKELKFWSASCKSASFRKISIVRTKRWFLQKWGPQKGRFRQSKKPTKPAGGRTAWVSCLLHLEKGRWIC